MSFSVTSARQVAVNTIEARPFAASIAEQVEAAGRRLGAKAEIDARLFQEYSAMRIAHLALVVGEVSFEEAVRTEAVNTLLVAAGIAIDQADAVDREITRELLGLVSGGMFLAAKFVAGVPPV